MNYRLAEARMYTRERDESYHQRRDTLAFACHLMELYFLFHSQPDSNAHTFFTGMCIKRQL